MTDVVALAAELLAIPSSSYDEGGAVHFVSRRLLAREGRTPAGSHAAWDYHDAAQILNEVATLTPSYAGISHAR